MKNEIGERIERDISFWINKEKGLKELFRNDIVNEGHVLKEKLRYFSSIRDKYNGNVTEGEQITLNVLNGEIKKLERQIYQNPLIRLLARIERTINKIKVRSKPIIESRIKSHALNFNPKKFQNNSNIINESVQKNIQGISQEKINSNTINESTQTNSNEISKDQNNPNTKNESTQTNNQGISHDKNNSNTINESTQMNNQGNSQDQNSSNKLNESTQTNNQGISKDQNNLNTINESTQTNSQGISQDQNNILVQEQKNDHKNDNRVVNDYKTRLSVKNNLRNGKKLKHKIR